MLKNQEIALDDSDIKKLGYKNRVAVRVEVGRLRNDLLPLGVTIHDRNWYLCDRADLSN